jgi:hypothetical protein
MSYLKIPPFYRNPDGTRPALAGKFVFLSEHEYRECCCEGVSCHCYWYYEWDCDADDWVLTDSGMSDVFDRGTGLMLAPECQPPVGLCA